MKTFRKSIIVIITSLTLLIGVSNMASAEPLQTPKSSSYLSDIDFTLGWTVRFYFGKDITQQIAEKISIYGNEGIAGVCAAISGGAVFASGLCTAGISYFTSDIRDAFIKAADNKHKTEVDIPCFGFAGIAYWSAKEMLEE